MIQTQNEMQSSGGVTRTLAKDLPVGTRLPELLRKQRKVPDWAFLYPELFDPVRLFSKMMLIGALIGLLLVPIWFLVGLAVGIGFLGQVAAVGPLVTLGAYAITVPRRRTNAFYLRAFSTDRRTHAFRRALEVALGSDFRLSGIRSPRHQWPDILKGVAGGLAVFRYAGARYMELEASDGWMGRLLASFVHTRIAFVDLRQITPNVKREAVLTFLCLGSNRTVFVIDQSRSAAEWAKLAGDLVLSPGVARPALQFVDADGDIASITSEVRGAVGRLPDGAAGFSEAGWAYVASHVPEEDLIWESQRKPERMIILGAVLISVVLNVVSVMAMSDKIALAFGMTGLLLAFGMTGLLFFALFARAIGGAGRRAWKARSVNREFANNQFDRALAGACLPILAFGLMASGMMGQSRLDERMQNLQQGAFYPTSALPAGSINSYLGEPDSILMGVISEP